MCGVVLCRVLCWDAAGLTDNNDGTYTCEIEARQPSQVDYVTSASLSIMVSFSSPCIICHNRSHHQFLCILYSLTCCGDHTDRTRSAWCVR